MKTKHTIINGDSRNMNLLSKESVDLVITSPPYWQLKDYGSEDQIGFNDTYENYINNLNLVWKNCYNVLKKGCRLCVNIGDQFARSVYYGRYKIIPIRTEIIKFCESIGFDYMGAIIWQKTTTCNTTGGGSVMGSYPYPRNGILKLDYEFILIFKKLGKTKKIDKEIKEKSKMTKEEWNEYFSGHWNFAGERQKKHLAMFPMELPKRLIKMFSFVGDTIMDPFMGSGTTSLVSKMLERNSIGFEINKDFIPIIEEKLEVKENTLLYKDVTFEINKQEKINYNYEEEINKLPYIFKDSVTFDKKIDPRNMNYGSKINKESKEREKYFSVKEIISSDKVVLNNNIKIKLIGIKPNKEKEKEAIDYLKKKFKNTRVYLKYDDLKHDSENNLFCYVYLKNKTFINAKLIKENLANVETSYDYKNRNKFIKYANL